MADKSSSEAVHVVARVRPAVKHETARGDKSVVVCTDDGKHVQIENSETKVAQSFKCNAAFQPAVSQEEMFRRCGVRALLERALHGNAATLFAYGQTGAGKTHTILGDERAIGEKGYSGGRDSDGIVPRAVNYLFEVAEAKAARRSISLRASCLEVYNEQVFDLMRVPRDGPPVPMAVRYSTKAGFYVEDLMEVPCKSKRELFKVLSTAVRNRQVASHKLNTRSSRGHLMITIHIDSVPVPASAMSTPEEGAKRPSTTAGARDDDEVSFGPPPEVDASVSTYGRIAFVDLAGSERLNESGSTGQTRVETGQINKSLFTLGKVIAALGRASDSPHLLPSRSGVRARSTRQRQRIAARQSAAEIQARSILESAYGIEAPTVRAATAAPSMSGRLGASTPKRRPSGGFGSRGGTPTDRMTSGGGVVSYRDSKLTMLLRDSLGGSGVALMIACCAPTRSTAVESLRTLQFAMGVKRVRNKAVVLLNPQQRLIAELRSEIAKLREENARLRAESVSAQAGLPPLGAGSAGALVRSGGTGAVTFAEADIGVDEAIEEVEGGDGSDHGGGWGDSLDGFAPVEPPSRSHTPGFSPSPKARSDAGAGGAVPGAVPGEPAASAAEPASEAQLEAQLFGGGGPVLPTPPVPPQKPKGKSKGKATRSKPRRADGGAGSASDGEGGAPDLMSPGTSSAVEMGGWSARNSDDDLNLGGRSSDESDMKRDNRRGMKGKKGRGSKSPARRAASLDIESADAVERSPPASLSRSVGQRIHASLRPPSPDFVIPEPLETRNRRKARALEVKMAEDAAAEDAREAERARRSPAMSPTQGSGANSPRSHLTDSVGAAEHARDRVGPVIQTPSDTFADPLPSSLTRGPSLHNVRRSSPTPKKSEDAVSAKLTGRSGASSPLTRTLSSKQRMEGKADDAVSPSMGRAPRTPSPGVHTEGGAVAGAASKPAQSQDLSGSRSVPHSQVQRRSKAARQRAQRTDGGLDRAPSHMPRSVADMGMTYPLPAVQTMGSTTFTFGSKSITRPGVREQQAEALKLAANIAALASTSYGGAHDASSMSYAKPVMSRSARTSRGRSTKRSKGHKTRTTYGGASRPAKSPLRSGRGGGVPKAAGTTLGPGALPLAVHSPLSGRMDGRRELAGRSAGLVGDVGNANLLAYDAPPAAGFRAAKNSPGHIPWKAADDGAKADAERLELTARINAAGVDITTMLPELLNSTFVPEVHYENELRRVGTKEALKSDARSSGHPSKDGSTVGRDTGASSPILPVLGTASDRDDPPTQTAMLTRMGSMSSFRTVDKDLRKEDAVQFKKDAVNALEAMHFRPRTGDFVF